MLEYKKSPRHFSSWEMGECNDHKTIYLNLRGMSDKRYAHFHIQKEDVKILINDLQKLIDNQDERLQLKLKYNLDVK